MYLLSTGSAGGFTDADETAVRAVTEAGMAALASDINSSTVSLGPGLLADTRLREALDGPAVPVPDEDGLEGPSLQQVFVQVANEGLLNEYPRMSMAIVDKSGNILARTGLAPELFDELVKMAAMESALDSEEPALLSSTLAGKLHAVKLSRPLTDAAQRRLVTIRAVELGGGSFFRGVVGTRNPAGLVRDGEVLGDAIGGAKHEELIAFATQHMDSIPPEGASGVFMVNDGSSDGRLGSAARVPGPAGKGKSGTLFVVLSSNTLGSTQQDMATALQVALDAGGLKQLNWILVGGLLVISLGLTMYLPHIEYNTPLRRLAKEFNGITEGRQHELYHDTYGGELGLVARSAATAMEALRVSWENELLDSDAQLSDGGAPRRTRSTRSLRAAPRRARSQSHESLSSSQVDADESLPLDTNDRSASQAPSRAVHHEPDAIDLPGASAPPLAPPPAPSTKPPAPAPAFSDEVDPPALALDGDSVSFAGLDAGLEVDGGGEDDRESYYRRIYDEFVETKGACGEPTEGFTYEKFAKKLRKQSDTLLSRADVTDVQFSVYVKDGKAALRAKVVKT
ncbi:Antifreeze glycopeptide AFGP polyprotein precursor [Enhygromyxa salina]|uniref:Antifreeze glycopeptide AFGP polyprotein n=2 Tax=Enhygromyxa salina TaxID=215803 RepID=A0A0C2D807_9BACT|nr:MXAN_5187 family protein [Enhygromyxa salina]KIG19241.1 Antifreeze glycopeptide AFGP polyprotein precursor [Enhygromyxa salina]